MRSFGGVRDGNYSVYTLLKLELMLALERWSWESSDSPPRDWIPLQFCDEGHVTALMLSIVLNSLFNTRDWLSPDRLANRE